MNAIPSEPARAPTIEDGLAELSGRLRASAVVSHSVWPLLGILTVFWSYVALSNVLYANSMQVSISSMAPGGNYFAKWDVRLVQHAALYPVFILLVWASMRIGWQRPWRAVPAQLLIALVFSALAAPALVLGEHLMGSSEMERLTFTEAAANFFAMVDKAMWMASATSFFLAYGFGLALVNGFALYQRFRDAQLRSAALERALTAAHLAALRMQLSPHTLFNLLHTIRGQISWDPAAAQSMVVQLGDLLRRLLTAGERDSSRLADELQFVRLYLELQQQRFADRLTVWIADIEHLPQLWVPSLILQPLVENAVVHGLAGHTGAVVIRVEASIEGDALSLRVVNTVARDAAVGRESIGLRNVRERLALQFGDHAIFQSRESEPGLWSAEIRLPLLREGLRDALRDGQESARNGLRPGSPDRAQVAARDAPGDGIRA